MSLDRAGNSTFWTSIKKLVLGDTVTADLLYTDGIDKLADRSVWLRDAITRVRSDFANATAGTKATITGSVDLSTLVYDPIVGTLNGITLQFLADTGGTLTAHIGTGDTAPTGPADVVTQILAATSAHQGAFVDSAGHLNITSNTTGGSSTISAAGGSLSLVGFTGGSGADGLATGADGISHVSGAAITPTVSGVGATVPAGTLRSMIQFIADKMRTTGSQSRRETTLAFNYTHSPPYPIFAGSAALPAGDNCAQPIAEPPHGSTLTSVTVSFQPDTHSALPANMPFLRINKLNIVTGGGSQLGSDVHDVSANVTAYDQIHSITVSGLSEVIDRTTYVYQAALFIESGSNSDNNTTYWGTVTTFTV